MTTRSIHSIRHKLNDALNQEALWPLLEELGHYKEVQAGHCLLAANTKPAYVYVIIEGLLRHFYPSVEGRERNKNFFREGQLSGSLSAWITEGISPYELQALEDSVLLEIPAAKLKAIESHPAIINMITITTRELFLRNEQREAVLLTKTGEERYRWLLDNENWIAERLPQYHIASYLGMDAVSLSRLKAKLSKTSAF